MAEQTRTDAVTFRAQLWGFDRDEVRAFVQNLVAEHNAVGRQLERVRAELQRAERSPRGRDGHDNGEATRAIEKTLSSAHRLADEIRADAQREAERILADAERRACHALESARAQASQIVSQATAQSDAVEARLARLRTEQHDACQALEATVAALEEALAEIRSQPHEEIAGAAFT